MKLVIGIAGLPLAGKETVADTLATLLKSDGFDVARHRFSDVLRDTLDLWGISHGRDNEQLLAQLMDQFKRGTLSRAVKNRIAKDAAHVGILDGVRWLSDEEMIRELAKKGMKSLMIYVDASADTRYERLQKRNRADESKTTREEFERQNQQKNETDIPSIGNRADIKLKNDHRNIADLGKIVEEAYRSSIRPLLQ
jgi:dephospho-CoA kinase